MSEIEGRSFDLAIAGAGILGLSCAYHAARAGLSVVVLERHLRARGASVRNFGMIWPIGQPSGSRREVAERSRALWQEVARSAGLWHDPCGSLHLAYRDDEAQVLREFAAMAGREGRPCELLSPGDVAAVSPGVRGEGLRLGLRSRSEMAVDPREVVAALPDWLRREHGVAFAFGRGVTGFDPPLVATTTGAVRAERLLVCSGDDLLSLYPEALRAVGLVRCRLQMLRARPRDPVFRLGPMLAAGLTLRHYASFAGCPTLEAVRARVTAASPEFDRHGIHVMVSQNGTGELTIGDSHAYDQEFEPFDDEDVTRLILGYLDGFFPTDQFEITQRWSGTYARHPTEPWVVLDPAPGVRVLTGVGGAGMTLSFGLAERVIGDLVAEGRR